ncbi:MAG: Vms1/Ankzf1 family peptidyl-tRNA hydrolase [Mycobacteriales bacterium]
MQLRDLSDVLAAEGPFVTVHVGAESAVEQAADRYETGWRSLLKQLEEKGVGEPVRQALSAARGEHAEGEARLLVASVPAAEVLLAEPVSTRPATDLVQIAPLPDLLPLMSDLAARVPHVVVHADRTGADVDAFFDVGTVAAEVTVRGRTLHLKKVPGGGWAHHRYQHRTENQWRENAKEIRETVSQLAEQVGAELVIGVGDERELIYVREGLPQPWNSRWVELPGGRSQDGSEQLVLQRIRDTVALHAAADTLSLLADYAQERGQDKRACDGLPDVVQALRKAQVETLLLTTDPDQHSSLWFGEQPSQLGTSRADVEGLGATTATEGPMIPVLLRAALATGADVQLVPHQSEQAPQSGLGAILRYADSGS